MIKEDGRSLAPKKEQKPQPLIIARGIPFRINPDLDIKREDYEQENFSDWSDIITSVEFIEKDSGIKGRIEVARVLNWYESDERHKIATPAGEVFPCEINIELDNLTEEQIETERFSIIHGGRKYTAGLDCTTEGDENSKYLAYSECWKSEDGNEYEAVLFPKEAIPQIDFILEK